MASCFCSYEASVSKYAFANNLKLPGKFSIVSAFNTDIDFWFISNSSIRFFTA